MASGAAALAAVLLAFGVVALPGQTTTPGAVEAQGSLALSDLEQRFADIYNTYTTSVVSIQVFEQNAYGQGSGFVYDTAGHIVTNYHVTSDALDISVGFSDGTVIPAELVGQDADSDLAVIRIDPIEAPATQPLTLGDSNALQVGQMVVALGNPFGLSNTMTTGIVSALGRSLPSVSSQFVNGFRTYDVIQTDAAINPGNSGGPLFNLAGEVVGVNTAIRSESESNSGIGFAVPANLIARVVPSLVSNGEYQHPYLGIAGRTVTDTDRELMNLTDSQQGVLVAEVTSSGPAANAGLHPSTEQAIISGGAITFGGDILIAVNGEPITIFEDLTSYLSQYTAVGETVTFDVLRDGKTIQVPVTLGARPVVTTTSTP